MGLDGADFANALKSRKKYVEANDEGGEGTGTGTNTTNQLAAASAGIMGFSDKSPTGFCGLANQGATCYLNSLLQSLFMLTEFRAALYAWEYRPAEHGDEERNVARQLQRLFAYLQSSDRCCVTTQALTRSFGWTTGEQFQQQDVQECSAVIMDYLSRIAVGSSLETHLHEHTGSTNRILRCQCGAERCREETFRDLQLEVKDAGTGSMMDPKSQDPIGSVDRALAAYCGTETLEGVSCEACGEQRDHDKLLRFSQLPLYLPLVLKRFAMNWNTGQRMKLSDWMSIPLQLDLASLVQPSGGEQSGETVAPETTYHLKSVLMHTGGAYGGHYFCYQQAAREGSPWCKFNDASVTELTEEEVAAAFSLTEPEPEPVPPPPQQASGQTDSGTSTPVEEATAASAAAGTIQAVWKRKKGSSSTKRSAQPAIGRFAYMLIYVRADGLRRAASTPPAPPKDLYEEVEADNAKYRQLRAEWKEEQRWLRFKLRTPSGNDADELEVRILREDTVGNLLDKVMEILECASAREDCRIRVVHRQTGSLLEALSGDDGDATVLDALVKPRSAPPTIALETKSPGEPFCEFKPGSTPIKLHEITADGDTTHVASVAVPKPATVGQLRQLVAEHLQCDLAVARLIIVVKTEGIVTEFRELQSADDFLTLSSQDLTIGSEVVIEDAKAAGPSALSHFDKLVNRLEIGYRVVPSGTSGTIEIDGRSPLSALKQRLSVECTEVAGWTSGKDADPCAAFKLRLGDRFGGTGKEIKDLKQNVGAAGFSALNNLVIEEGRPLGPNEFSITLRLVSPGPAEGVPPPAEGQPGTPPPGAPRPGPPPPGPPPPPVGASSSAKGAEDLCGRGSSIVISQQDEVGELKHRAVDLASCIGVELSANCMRLRLSEAGKLGAVLVDGVSLEDALPKGKRLHDGLCIAIQPTDGPEVFTRSHLLIRVQLWLPDKCQLRPHSREIAIESGVTTAADLQRQLAVDVPGVDSDPCPPDAIKFLKAMNFQIRDREALPMLWHTKAQPSAESYVTAGVLNLKAGDLLLFKDSRIPEQIDPPPTDQGSDSKSDCSAQGRPEAPGFRILTPSEQIEAEREAARSRRIDGQDAADIAKRMDAVKAARLGSSGGIARTNSV